MTPPDALPPAPDRTIPQSAGSVRRDALRADLRFRLLRTLDTTPNLSQRGLAEAIGVSLGAANAVLNAMIEAGLVQIAGTTAARSQFRISYAPSDAGRAEARRLRAPYLARRRAERAALDAEIAALEAEGPDM